MNRLTTMNKLEETWKYCNELFGDDRCIALCLCGSQNYQCDLPDSDIDAKLMITPTWKEVIECKQPMSQTISGPYGDINVTDIRLFIGNNLKKQNFNFLECLFTPYKVVNKYYEDLWEELLEYREEIAHYNPAAAIRTMMGQVENQYGRWGRFDKHKTLYHMMRMSHAIEFYQKGEPFEKTLVPINLDHIMKVRLGKVCEEDMDFMFGLFYTHAHYCADKVEYAGPECPNVERAMDDLQARFVYRALYEFEVEE